MAKNKKNSVHYARNAASSEIESRRTYVDSLENMEKRLEELRPRYLAWDCTNEIQNEYLTLEKKIETIKAKQVDLRRKTFDYNCGYSFLLDGIAVLCTDYKSQVFSIAENDYYIVKLSPETLEAICLGEYAKDAAINHIFWDNFAKVAKEPKTLVMVTDEGTFQGEPIRLLIKRKNDTTVKNGHELTNLKNVSGNPIEYIQLEFFQPMFRDVLENDKKWIELPRHLQAILYNSRNKHPELFKFVMEDNNTKTPTDLTIDTVRKYFLYMTEHNNNQGEYMHVNAIDFFNHVKPSEVKNGNQLQNWFKAKQGMDALCRLHNFLVNNNLLEGIKFNTGNVWYNQNTKIFDIKVKRDKPLTMQIENTPRNELPPNYTPEIPF